MPSANADIKIVPGAEDGTSDLQVSWHEGRRCGSAWGWTTAAPKVPGVISVRPLWLSMRRLHRMTCFTPTSAGCVSARAVRQPFTYAEPTLFPGGILGFLGQLQRLHLSPEHPNANEVLRYSGKSDNIQLTVSRLLYRDQSHKLTLNLRGYRKHSTNAVDNVDIVSQNVGPPAGAGAESAQLLLVPLRWTPISTGAAAPAHSMPCLPRKSRVMKAAHVPAFCSATWVSIKPFSLGRSALAGVYQRKGAVEPERADAAGADGHCRALHGAWLDGEQMLSGERACYGAMKSPGTCFLAGMNCIWPPTTDGCTAQTPATLVGHHWRAARSACAARWGRFSYDLFAGVPLYKPAGFHLQRDRGF